MSENSDFLASRLSSRDLLALLYSAERKRTGEKEGAWEEFTRIFADRLGNLSEELRFQVLEAHLMSVEDLDIYDNHALETLLSECSAERQILVAKLETDPRFYPG